MSIWAGTLPREDYERLLAERYCTDASISGFARALGIAFYDHDLLESIHLDAPTLAGVAMVERAGVVTAADCERGPRAPRAPRKPPDARPRREGIRMIACGPQEAKRQAQPAPGHRCSDSATTGVGGCCAYCPLVR